MRQKGLGEPNGAKEVRLHDAPDLRKTHLLGGTEHTDPRIVHQHVQAIGGVEDRVAGAQH